MSDSPLGPYTVTCAVIAPSPLIYNPSGSLSFVPNFSFNDPAKITTTAPK